MKQLVNANSPPARSFSFGPKVGIRARHRREEGQRIKEAPSLAQKFPTLKSLKVTLRFFDGAVGARFNEIKYAVNLDHAKSVFRFGCVNPECVQGDFDLSRELALAVDGRRRKAAGELQCQGWKRTESIGTIRCHRLLRFEFALAY